MKAKVNQDGCISCGFCIDTCPEVFHFNDDAKSTPISGEISKDCVMAAQEARDGCPVQVIDIEE